MRKTIFIFIAAIVTCACVSWVRWCSSNRTAQERFAHRLTLADMYEYKDEDFGYTIRYPSFFSDGRIKDSEANDEGRARFVYYEEGATMVIEGYAIRNNGMSLKEGMDSLGEALQATDRRLGNNSFTLSGPQYEEGRPISGYSYYSKFVAHRKLWFVYTMVFPDTYRPALSRMFKEIDGWQVWEKPKPRLKQGENQTPKWD